VHFVGTEIARIKLSGTVILGLILKHINIFAILITAMLHFLDIAEIGEREQKMDHDKFVTKDSGERLSWDSGMQRDTNEDKIRFDLLFTSGQDFEDQFIVRLAKLLTRGAKKYNARNWELAQSYEEMDRAKESAIRHFIQWFLGEEDEDHAAAVVFNIMEVEYVKQRLGVKK
jgi:dATP/dGTP diphosphohydrolase, N-terminal